MFGDKWVRQQLCKNNNYNNDISNEVAATLPKMVESTNKYTTTAKSEKQNIL